MKRMLVIVALMMLLAAVSSSAMAWVNNWNPGTGYDQLQITWVAGDKFDSVGFWDNNEGWNVYSTSTLFIATKKDTTSANYRFLGMYFQGSPPTNQTSFVWQQFNGSVLLDSELATSTYGSDFGKPWTWVNNDPATTGVGNTRLNNPAVPEPGTILAALSVLGPAAFAFRRKRA